MEFESAIKKNLWIFFQKHGFIRKVEPFHLRMMHNIIQMAATAGLTSTPFDQSNFSVHFRLFGLQSHEWQLRFRVSRPQFFFIADSNSKR